MQKTNIRSEAPAPHAPPRASPCLAMLHTRRSARFDRSSKAPAFPNASKDTTCLWWGAQPICCASSLAPPPSPPQPLTDPPWLRS